MCEKDWGDEVNPVSIEELAARIRRGELKDGMLADFAVRYAQARKIFRKKDD